MGAFQRPIAALSDDQLARAEHADMGLLGLSEQVRMLRLIRKELEAAEVLTYDEIPNGVQSTVLNGVFDNDLESVVERMIYYGPDVTNPGNERAAIADVIRHLRDLVLEKVRPLVRPDDSRAEALLAEARAMLHDAHAKLDAQEAQYNELVADTLRQRAELSLQQTSLAVDSAETVAADLSPHYATQATNHRSAASWLLIASIVVGALFALATWVALFKSPPEYVDPGSGPGAGSAEQWIEFVRGTLGRLTFLSLGGLALAFCLRNYRVNRHLEVVNKRRENALKTFGLLQAAVTTDDARNLVVAELVRSVFGTDETGYLSGQTDRTVIESPGGGGILAAMTAARSGPTTS